MSGKPIDEFMSGWMMCLARRPADDDPFWLDIQAGELPPFDRAMLWDDAEKTVQKYASRPASKIGYAIFAFMGGVFLANMLGVVDSLENLIIVSAFSLVVGQVWGSSRASEYTSSVRDELKRSRLARIEPPF